MESNTNNQMEQLSHMLEDQSNYIQITNEETDINKHCDISLPEISYTTSTDESPKINMETTCEITSKDNSLGNVYLKKCICSFNLK